MEEPAEELQCFADDINLLSDLAGGIRGLNARQSWVSLCAPSSSWVQTSGSRWLDTE